MTLLVAAALSGALVGVLPDSSRVMLAGSVQAPDPAQVAVLRMFGQGEAWIRVSDTPWLCWYSFALEPRAGVARWPAGARIYLDTPRGCERAVEQWAITPEGRMVGLGSSMPLALPAGSLAQKRFRGGTLCVVIFAAFPAGTVEPTGVRIGRLDYQLAPHGK